MTFCNMANLDAAMRGGLMELIEVHLKCVGGGPTLDHADATVVPRAVSADHRRGVEEALQLIV